MSDKDLSDEMKSQLAFDMAMDLQRFRLLLNQICDATGHEDYEAAVETLLAAVRTNNETINDQDEIIEALRSRIDRAEDLLLAAEEVLNGTDLGKRDHG
ncbi:hypothetical protein LCGC14_2860120 [marine sediment metagenome]|uniref:Uncharacterized protein n=1 Tax=marine sediment metagenome TaxID=412755 RepID=A0A0F8Y5S2_9ZZZZ